MSAVPDVPSIVAGWRAWRVFERDDGPRLGSMFVAAVEWPARAEMVADCLISHHPGPVVGCQCGLYAVADLGAAALMCTRGAVLGCVALWGKMIEGERGWRAARGYPMVLFAGPSIDEHTRWRLGERYGVVVHAVPAELDALAAVHGPRLGELGQALRERAATGGRPDGSWDELSGSRLGPAVAELLEEMDRVAPRAHAWEAARPRPLNAGLRGPFHARSMMLALVAVIVAVVMSVVVATRPAPVPRGNAPAAGPAPAAISPLARPTPAPRRVFLPVASRRALLVDVPRLNQMVVSRDGGVVAAEYTDGTTVLWNITGGGFRAIPIAGPALGIGFEAIALTPDGRTLISAVGAPGVRLYDTATGALRATLPTGWVNYLAMSPNGHTLALGGAGTDSTIYLWDIQTRTAAGSLQSRFISSPIAFNDDGTKLASGGWNDAVRVWDLTTGAQIAEMQPGPAAGSTNPDNQLVYGVAFSPDGKTLATVHGDALRLWDLPTRRQTATLEVTNDSIAFRDRLVFSPDGRILASGTSDGIQLWDIGSRSLIATQLPGAVHTGMSFLPDGDTLITTSTDNTLNAWSLTGR